MSRSTTRIILAGAALAAATATGALAADAPAPAAAGGSTALDGLTVAVPRTAPVVVKTFPAQGATIASGALVLTVTFDQAMDSGSWSYAKAATGEYPQCLVKPRLLADNRTFVLLCTTGESTAYAMALNAGESAGFVSVGHRATAPYELRFSTSNARSVGSLKDALSTAGLKPEDSPIETTDQAAR